MVKNKWIKRLIILIIAIVLSIGVQTGILYFVRSYYIASDLNMEVADYKKATTIKKQIEVSIPENFDYILPSNNGKYLLYVVGEEAHVVDFESNNDTLLQKVIKDETTDEEEGTQELEPIVVDYENTHFYWHDTEEKLIIAQVNENGYLGLNMYNYNPKVGTVERALDYNNKPRTYTMSNYDQKIADIRINNANTILYLKLSTEYRSNIYRLDISDDLEKMSLMSNNIGDFRILKNLDSIVYEELNNEKLYISDKIRSTEINIEGTNKLKLLGLENNILYIGDMDDNGLVKTIYSMDIEDGYDSTKTWNNKELDEPKEIEDIIISKTGNVYINNDLEGSVMNLNTSKKTKYDGKFVGIYKDQIVSRDGNTVYRKGVK